MKEVIRGFLTATFGMIAALVLSLVIGYVVKETLTLPEVYTSYTTGECVAIILEDGTRVGCERLSEFPKYENVWVQ
jgi:hypothetical protein